MGDQARRDNKALSVKYLKAPFGRVGCLIQGNHGNLGNHGNHGSHGNHSTTSAHCIDVVSHVLDSLVLIDAAKERDSFRLRHARGSGIEGMKL